MTKVKITWKSFGDNPDAGLFVSSVEFDYDFGFEEGEYKDLSICEYLFANTNLYKGGAWDIIQPLLSDTRTHTSLSIGDEVEIDGVTYICANMGFLKIEDAVIKRFDDGSIFTVDKVRV
jgi:hypothetical protein